MLQKSKKNQEATEASSKERAGDMTIIPSLPNEIAVHILAFLPRAFFSTLGLVCCSWRDALQPDGPVIAFRKRRNLLETWIIFMSVKDEHLQFLLVDPVHCGCLEIVPPSPISSPTARNMSLGLSSPMVVGSEVLIPAESLQQGSRLYCFDVQSMQWKDSFPFFTKRPFPIMYATAQGDECMYFAGGASHSGDLKEAKRLVIKTRMWEALPDMQEKRVYASGVVLQGQFCVIGGYHKLLSGSVNTGEIWDPNSRQWTLIPELWPANIFGEYTRKPCIAVVKDRLYALRVTSHKNVQELMYYEDATKLWMSMGEFCFPALVESECAFHFQFQMVGGAEELLVVCHAKPLVDAHVSMVVLSVKPTLSKPLTWKILPLTYPVHYLSEPCVLRV